MVLCNEAVRHVANMLEAVSIWSDDLVIFSDMIVIRMRMYFRTCIYVLSSYILFLRLKKTNYYVLFCLKYNALYKYVIFVLTVIYVAPII